MLNSVAVLGGIVLVLTVLWEVFETIVLPRRVTRQFRLTRAFYRGTWLPYAALAGMRKSKKKRDMLLSFYGPLSLLLLLAFWAVTLVFGFALIHFGDGESLSGTLFPSRLGNALYLSGTTLFTLGLGDITPASPLARFVTVLEAGIGFGFLALVIGYLPVLYQSFSRREVTISLLDARAGSPPTAFELLRRHAGVTLPHSNPTYATPQGAGCDIVGHDIDALTELLHDWERWAAELMESHLSYPVLAYFRSQHDNQSWLGSLTVILDVCALAMVGLEGMCQYQARMTFAITRHALVDLSQVFSAPPDGDGSVNRLTPEDLAEIRRQLRSLGLSLADGQSADAELIRIRGLYEPYAISLAQILRLELPPWIKRERVKDNWQTTAWQPRKIAECPTAAVRDEHF